MRRIIRSFTNAALVAACAVPLVAHAQGAATATGKTAAGATSHATAPPTTGKAPTSPEKSASHHKLDLNSASREELMKLPGVTDSAADKIIADRPWKSKSDLVQKGVLDKAAFDKVQSMLYVKAPETEKPKK